MQEHPLVELYVTTNDSEQNNIIEQLLASVNIDEVALLTLQTVGITQPIMLTLLVTDDAGIREMNTQYRQQDKPTDVLSFPLLEKPLANAPADQLWSIQSDDEQPAQKTPDFVTPPDMIMNLGDIVMSWPTLVRQATEAGHSSLYELLYLFSHGVLHLVGYDDHTEAGYQAMVGIQEAVLRKIGQKA
jgi:probable rRNA maturation factor